MAIDGITALIYVAQTKSGNANEEALQAAKGQTKLINEQKKTRGQQRVLEEKLRDKMINADEVNQIRNLMVAAGFDPNKVDFKFDGDMAHIGADGVNQDMNTKMGDMLKGLFADKISDLEGQDKTDNFFMQDLMSTVNQNETLASSLLKKADDTKSGVIGKI